MKWNLRMKISLSVGLILFGVFGISTIIHVVTVKQDYIEDIGLRSEALAQMIVDEITERATKVADIQDFLSISVLKCQHLYKLHKANGAAHFAVINASHVIAAHNDHALMETETRIENPKLLEALDQQKLATVLVGDIYSTLIPIFNPKDNEYIGAVDIGVYRNSVDLRVRQMFLRSTVLFVAALFFAWITLSILIKMVVTGPLTQLVRLGQHIAEGQLTRAPMVKSRDEIYLVTASFNLISDYLQNVTEAASRIATGVLDHDVQIRSSHDVLGQAFRDMIHYLRQISVLMGQIAEGDLSGTIHVRSEDDSFGRMMHTMKTGIHALIVRIHTSSKEIADTGREIASLSATDIGIVEHVHTSIQEMLSTVQQTGASIEEVAQNMEVLSSSVEETSASVTQMTSTITHIAANASDLTNQSHKTIDSLEKTVNSLELVVQSTDTSKKLSEETIGDALEGQQAVEHVMNSMETMQQTMTSAVDTMTSFEQRSREIDAILEVIRNITEQTGLLALNASIIAAQAGAHGKGFAVVADEIKTLANGVETSTKDIAKIVQALQHDANQVVRTVHEGADNVKQGMERTRQAQEKLQKIITSARRSFSVVTEITDALHGLEDTSHSVTDAMKMANTMADDITVATEEHKLSTGQIHKAIENINNMAAQVQQATSQQLTGIRYLIEATNDIDDLSDSNLNSSRNITETAGKLLSNADELLHSVDTFRL